jgi:putative transposase
VARELLSRSNMARVPRRLLVAEGTVNHCTWRGHNLSPVLGTPAAKQRFLELLAEHKDEYGIEIYSYSLMDTHQHLQSRSRLGQEAFSKFWQIVNYRFARWYNKVNESCGQVVMDRMSSGQIEDDTHQLAVMRYGDLNPVRAGIVQSPSRWSWSSYRHYAFGEENSLVTDAPAYVALGDSPAERRKAYVHLFARRLAEMLRVRRADLVIAPFIGTPGWIRDKLLVLGAPPPS